MKMIQYSEQNGYLIPDLIVPDEAERLVGKYASLHRTYLMEHRYGVFLNLLTQGKLGSYLCEIQKSAEERRDQLIEEMSRADGVTERLKAENQMEWLGRMNEIRQSAEEIVMSELIYN